MSDADQVEIQVVIKPIDAERVRELAHMHYGDMVKAVVDVKLRRIALGGDLHADEESVLLEGGSEQADLWGINIYPEKPRSEWIEFDSLINIRPRQQNRSRNVEDAQTRELISDIVDSLIL